MTYAVSMLVVLGQAVVGFTILAFLLLLGVGIASGLGFLAPMPSEEPNPRWLRRQQKKRKVTEKQQMLRYLAKKYASCQKEQRDVEAATYRSIIVDIVRGRAIRKPRWQMWV